uniref:SDH assembly factor 2 n=1 Tax=Panagrolaimus sp. JU765 TaxID=591449 RepID=A0AC34R1F5_9BILA
MFLTKSLRFAPSVLRLMSKSMPVCSATIPEKSDLEKYRSKLYYQSMKRGILENDIIIGGFAQQQLKNFSEEELQAYDKIINGEHMEWDLFYYVSDKKPAPPELENCKVFQKIKEFVKKANGLERH